MNRVVECNAPEIGSNAGSTTELPSGHDNCVPLESVISTPELRKRPSRAPDYEAERRALSALAQAMANSAQNVLEKLVDVTLEMSRAQSTGVSILEEERGRQIFRWHAVAGQWAGYLGGTMPRDASPCGTVLDRNGSVLLSHPERYYPIPSTITPPIVEVLLIPFHIADKPIGTIWAIAHDESLQFDAEDERIMRSLGGFASAAYQTLKRIEALKVEAAERQEAEQALRRSESHLRDFFENATIGMHWVGHDGRILWANQAELDLLGYTTEEYVGHHILEFHLDAPVIEDILQRLGGGEVLREREARLRCKNGSVRDVLID
jgi:PAS domain S-box-containing protein